MEMILFLMIIMIRGFKKDSYRSATPKDCDNFVLTNINKNTKNAADRKKVN